MDSALEKVYHQSNIEETPAVLVEKGEIPFQAKVLEEVGFIDISNTLFTIGGQSSDSNRTARIYYLLSLLHKRITCQLIELSYPPHMEVQTDKRFVADGSRI